MPVLFDNLVFDWWDQDEWIKWHKDHWTISILITATYLLIIGGIRQWMVNRKPFNLKVPLIVWNTLLAIFSTIGALQSCYNAFWAIKDKGLINGLCDNSFMQEKAALFCGWLFAWSKVFELGDTLFLALRRKPLTLLHVYHHSITLIVCFYLYPTETAICRWTATLNFTVHSFMYLYFAITACGYRIPSAFAKALTIAQLGQMIAGILICIVHITMISAGLPCHGKIDLSLITIGVYFSYAILFAHLYVQKYSNKSRKSQ